MQGTDEACPNIKRAVWQSYGSPTKLNGLAHSHSHSYSHFLRDPVTFASLTFDGQLHYNYLWCITLGEKRQIDSACFTELPKTGGICVW